MAITLADLDKWNPDSIHAVFAAVTDHAANARLSSDGLGSVINAVPWDGKAHDAAKAANTGIRRDINLHAEELEAVAKAAKAAEAEIRDIKADWEHLKQEAQSAGMTIDPHNGTVTYRRSPIPAEAAIQESNFRIIVAEIDRLLQAADRADADLAAAIDGADGRMSADDVNKEVDDHWISTPEQAEDDVHSALAGDTEAAARVNNVLDSISADQQAGLRPLTPEQASVLSQLQAQENGMSLNALRTAADNLGDQKRMIPDSWQLMSNPTLKFPKTELTPGAKDDPSVMLQGGFDRLPTSMQRSLRGLSVGPDRRLTNLGDLRSIAAITRTGDPAFQHGTDLDRAMLGRATDLAGWSVNDIRTGAQNVDKDFASLNPVAQELFAAGAGDHVVDHELVTGKPGGLLDSASTDKFMDIVTANQWTDNGRSAAKVFEWTGHAPGAESTIAAETANAYSNYIGRHADGLLDMQGGQTLGQLNPDLVQGFSEGLKPYVSNIAGEHNSLTAAGFADADAGNVEKPIAKGIFSVLNTDPEAAKSINSAAYAEMVRDQNAFAKSIVDRVPGALTHTASMQEALNLKALVDVGTHNALAAQGLNDLDQAKQSFAMRSSAYDVGVKLLSTGAGMATGPAGGVGLEAFGTLVKSDILGQDPQLQTTPGISNMSQFDSARMVLNGLHANGVPLPHGLVINDNGVERLMTPAEYAKSMNAQSGPTYNDTLVEALSAAVPGDLSRINLLQENYNNLIKNPLPSLTQQTGK